MMTFDGTEADNAMMKAALDLLDQADADAQKIGADASGWLSRGKSIFTGTDVGNIQDEVASMHNSVGKMHDTYERLAADANTSHARAVDFVKGCAQVADLKELADSSARNSLVKMAHDVGVATIADVKSAASFGLPAIGLLGLAYLFLFRR